jgi:ribulose 1,5-bisphosphate synthetase/thiazole synthase
MHELLRVARREFVKNGYRATRMDVIVAGAPPPDLDAASRQAQLAVKVFLSGSRRRP